MNKKEQEFISQIKKKSDTANVPKSLEPEEMKKILESKPEKFVWRKIHTIAAAACCLLACGLAYGMTKDDYGKETGKAGYAAEEAEAYQSSGLVTAKSYEDVYEHLESHMEEENRVYDSSGADGDIMIMEESAADMAEDGGGMDRQFAAETKAENTAASGSYSETNVRQEGVDEGDVVKTDGRYLYTLRDNGRAVAIVDAKDGLEETAEVKLEDTYSIREFYVNKGKLVLVGEIYREEKTKGGWYMGRASTFAATFDLSDPQKPEKTGEVTQSGYYTSSRMSEGYLYLFSLYTVDTASGVEARDTKDYIPLVNESLIPEKDIYLPVTKNAYMYAVIGSVDMEKPDETKDSKAIFTDGGSLYVSNKNIYWYDDRSWYTGDTVIRRLSYQDGKLEAEASGVVGGYIHDSFCIDEYKDYLRVITTEKETNSVYVLDENLKEVGLIEGLAEDERVYSARLMGDVGYFVTYRETDPLFSVDFSDPKNPKIIGELKIPGFSEYLHFYGEDMLLGIGMDVDEDGFSTNGVKLSMFDISDNTDVKEVQKYVMKNVYSADVMYDYRAALIDVKKNIIGFSANNGDGENYYVFSYDKDNGFACLMDETVNGTGYQAARGVYIDDILYVVKGNIIEAYGMEDYKKVDDIIL